MSFSGPDLYFFGQVDGVDGWLEKVKIKLNSTQVAVEVEVRVELGNFMLLSYLESNKI